MIYRRAIAKLRAQDWFAIAVELAIVILGVFIGTQVSNWNQERADKREVSRLIERLGPTLKQTHRDVVVEQLYYANAQRYAEVALAGWSRDPHVSDEQFVIAAYQASQISGFTRNSQSFSALIGADQVRGIDDVALRTAIGGVLSYDFSSFSYQTMLTDYRKQVRELIPDSIQQSIRAACGDREVRGNPLLLPPTCTIALPADQVARTAAALRAHPELVTKLDYHLSEVATFVTNLARFDQAVRALTAMIDKH